jgi:tetratricopeptide (TPR) repeat protein
LYEGTLAVERAKLGRDHPRTLRTLSNLASAHWVVGRKASAIRLFEEVLGIQTAKFGPDHAQTLTMGYNLAICYRSTGQAAKAAPLFEGALAVYRVKPGTGDEGTLITMNHLASAYLDLKDDAKAEKLLRECLELREKYSPGKWQQFLTMSQLGAALAGQAKRAEAEPLLLTGYQGLRDREAQVPGALRKIIAEAGSRIVALYDAWGQPEKAAQWREKLTPPSAGGPAKP